MADSLAAHFPDWGATSRFASRDEAQAAVTADAPVGKSLSRRAASLAHAVASVEAAAPSGDRLAALFDGARGAATEAGGGETARRLVESVLRPLAEAICGRRLRTRAKLTDPRAVDSGAAALDSQIWKLAQDATTTLAEWDGDPGAQTLLMEATSALQDLALSVVPGNVRAARLATLREVMAGRAPEIRCAHNGPYLVTNAERVRDWLGQEIPLGPQVALCRCGGSEIKPICDGVCASNGFADRKDPKRVPDKRDRYEGVQLTVFDNRGICQHSGFCTDRLNTVFHTEGAFVAPSGGRMDDIIRAVRDCPSGALSFAVNGVEARDQVDWEHTREPAIEVTKDGPYRITGGIRLTNQQGEPVTGATGSSLEHYALCRCGHSQNKPFCSGMHWYVDFKDPVPDLNATPTLFAWAGGLPALTRMTRIFYEKHVPEDPLLAPLFANMSPDHPVRVARWLGEVLGGPKLYSDAYGGYDRMISQHLGKALTEEKRARWVELIFLSAHEAGLPSDAEFQAAFRSYIEWGSRIALENSQPGAQPPQHMPMPRWSWVCDATPGSRVSALQPAGAETAEDEVELPLPTETVGFEQHVKPLFRERDRKSMKFAFDLWSYDDVRTNAQAILERVKAGTMPCDGAWPGEWIEVFERWTQSGMSK